jgi:hypothetical protein
MPEKRQRGSSGACRVALLCVGRQLLAAGGNDQPSWAIT